MKENTGVPRHGDSFPMGIFLAYVVFYAGQAVYNCFKLVFMDEKGFTQSQIGWVGSISTVLLILIQPLFGSLSDRSKNKGYMVALMLFLLAGSCFAVYLAMDSLVWISICIIGYTLFYMTATNLQDNYSMEYLRDSRWHFGNIRMGGTLGYVLCAAVIGFIITDELDSMFWMTAIFYIPAAAMMLFMPKVQGQRKQKQKVDYRVLLKNRPLIVMFLFKLLLDIGGMFGGYYTIFFRNELGATNSMIALLTTICALTELPIFWYAGKIERRIGVRTFMIGSTLLSITRMTLLFFVRDITLVFIVQATSGLCNATMTYCYLNYVNRAVPRSMTATAQTLVSSLNMVVTSILLSPVVGWFSDRFGACNILLPGAVIIALAVVFFIIFFPRALAWQEKHPMEEAEEENAPELAEQLK